MPHLLIAGATGSGKSVCVNTIITSLVYRHTPQTLRFLMVDPKMVELSVYNTLPHLRHKVITDNRDAAAVLKWAVMEMQERYELLAANGCRNIQDFNKRVQDGAPLKMPKTPGVAFEDTAYKGSILPYIVVVIDEMADLMMTVQGEVETPIAMLAQKARAIGIHLILATQRPSVNVITGLIKANFPSRIAFRVASQIDSRTIIDGAGAEMLLGNGDMLFIPPGKSEPSRLQGAYLSSEDTERLMALVSERARGHGARRCAAQGLVFEESFDAEPDILEAVRVKEAADGEPGRRGRRSRSRAIATSCSARPRRSSCRTSRDRRRCCSAGSRSATAAPRASSTSSKRRACSDRRMARSRATFWSVSINSITSVARVRSRFLVAAVALPLAVLAPAARGGAQIPARGYRGASRADRCVAARVITVCLSDDARAEREHDGPRHAHRERLAEHVRRRAGVAAARDAQRRRHPGRGFARRQSRRPSPDSLELAARGRAPGRGIPR